MTNKTGGKLQGRGVFSTELLACLHPKHSIKEALWTFGVSAETSRLLLVLLETPDVHAPAFEEIAQAFDGESSEMSELYKGVNKDRVSEIFGINVTEFTENGGGGGDDDKKAFLLSILTRMSASLLVR